MRQLILGIFIGVVLGASLGAAYVAWAVQSRPAALDVQIRPLVCAHESLTKRYTPCRM